MNYQNNQSKSVAIIGAGLSGLSCATRLQTLGYQVELFEKSRGPSGRMSTRHGDGWAADHGAQYFTARDPRFVQELDSWISQNAAAVWSPDIKVYQEHHWRESHSKENRYVGTPDMSSPGKYLAKNLSVQFNQTINAIQIENGKWLLHSKESGQLSQSFDVLILALPAPQVYALSREIHNDVEGICKQANMKGCWTVMARFQEKPQVSFEAAFVNHELISWISRNNSKPGRHGLESWTIHANPDWSEQFIELEKDKATALIIECAKKLGLDCQNAEISTHRWRFASGSSPEIPGFYHDPETKFGLCGDWLHGGRVEGAWLSGYKLAMEIERTK